MPPRPKTTIANQLNLARLAIGNTRSDPELAALVAVFGYGEARIAEGQQLYDAAMAAVSGQVAANGAQRQATAQAAAAETRARASYQALAQLSRAVFARNSPERAALGLVGSMPDAVPAFLAAARTLFDNAAHTPGPGEQLAAYGYDAARLADERAPIDALGAALGAQAAAIGAAQQATRRQRDTLTALNRWVAQYLKIARIALRDKPDLIEKIGGLSRNAKTAAQRNAPRKAAATRAQRQAA